MKAVCKILVLAFVLGLALSALAANTGTIVLRNEAMVNGTKLAAGEYKVTVDGTGDAVKVSFTQGKNVVVTSNGKLVDAATAPEFSAVVVGKANGTSVIQEVHVAKLKAIVLLTK